MTDVVVHLWGGRNDGQERRMALGPDRLPPSPLVAPDIPLSEFYDRILRDPATRIGGTVYDRSHFDAEGSRWIYRARRYGAKVYADRNPEEGPTS